MYQELQRDMQGRIDDLEERVQLLETKLRKEMETVEILARENRELKRKKNE